jgi:hypothetical protein
MKRVKKYTLLMLLAAGLSAEVCVAAGEDDSQAEEGAQDEGAAQRQQIDTRNHGNALAQPMQIDTMRDENGQGSASRRLLLKLSQDPLCAMMSYLHANESYARTDLLELHRCALPRLKDGRIRIRRSPWQASDSLMFLERPDERCWNYIFSQLNGRNRGGDNPLRSITIPGTGLTPRQMLKQFESFYTRRNGLNLEVPVKLIMDIDRLRFSDLENENIIDYPFIATAMGLNVNNLRPEPHYMPLVRCLLDNSPNLKVLSLSGNNIGVDGALALAEVLKVNKSLIHLDVRRNKIGVVGATALFKALDLNTTLRDVDLSRNNIPGMTKEHLRIIASQKNITLTLD